MTRGLRAASLAAAMSFACLAAGARPAAQGQPPRPTERLEVPPPPFTEGIFPCTGCHETPGDPARRELGFHNEIQAIFTHGAEGRWCLDCHSNVNRDFLHLTGGDLVPFTESYRLCGQCHGDKYRDWRAGVHGTRIGRWNGAKSYFLCVNCHSPHAPRFQGVEEIVVEGRPTVSPTLTPMKPMPPPVRPEKMKR